MTTSENFIGTDLSGVVHRATHFRYVGYGYAWCQEWQGAYLIRMHGPITCMWCLSRVTTYNSRPS